MLISSRKNRQNLQSNTEIPYHDSVIKSCSTAKLLGVTVNNSLSWNDHIENAIHISICYHESKYISQLTDIRKRFYNAYILPHFDLCCVMWGNWTHYLEEKLVRLQKRSARIILDCDFYTSSSTMFSDLKWISFPERVIYIYESYSTV